MLQVEALCMVEKPGFIHRLAVVHLQELLHPAFNHPFTSADLKINLNVQLVQEMVLRLSVTCLRFLYFYFINKHTKRFVVSLVPL